MILSKGTKDPFGVIITIAKDICFLGLDLMYYLALLIWKAIGTSRSSHFYKASRGLDELNTNMINIGS